MFVALVVKLVLQCFELTSCGRLELSSMKCERECARVCVWNDGNCASTVGFSAISLKERFFMFLCGSFAHIGNNNIIVLITRCQNIFPCVLSKDGKSFLLLSTFQT